MDLLEGIDQLLSFEACFW